MYVYVCIHRDLYVHTYMYICEAPPKPTAKGTIFGGEFGRELGQGSPVELRAGGAQAIDHIMLCYVMLCYVMLCYVMLCYVMLCYVMLCYVMLCYAI